MNASGERTKKGRQGEEKEMCEGKDNHQAINSLSGADHKSSKEFL